jgi:plasmid maintenance system antidote protein VapI
MTKLQIEKFFQTHTALNVSAFCKEAGISKRWLDYILSDQRKLTPKTTIKIEPVMVKYGFKY